MDQPEQLDTKVDIANLWTSAQNLVLRSGSPHNYLRMVEHIIALKLGIGLDNVLLKVNSGDPPLFDQSSLPLIKAVDHAKIHETDEDATFVTVKEPVAFGGKRGDFLLFLPAENGERNLRIDCAISWNTVIGEQRVLFDATDETFRYAALARTNATHRQYILAKTVGKLFAATRNWGYNKKNILIHGPKKFYTEPRFAVGEKFLEPVWHRATLDLMAALALTGEHRFVGTVVSYRAGHTLDCDAIRALYRNDLLCQI
jgi:UDP-3-O-acyl-N-acetylglucosamine deacetylase